MSFVFASDLHLKPASSYRKTLLVGDAYYALKQIEQYILDHGVSTLILGGDVYDSNQPAGESSNLVSALVRNLTAHNVKVFYIEGNHDRINPNPYLVKQYRVEHRLLSSSGAQRLGTGLHEIDGMVFQGIDYCPSDKLHEKLQTMHWCDVLCIHAGFRHLIGFEDAYDLEKKDIPDTVKQAVLVGHIHVADSHQMENGVSIHSSGSTWPWRIDEAQKKHGFLHFDGDIHNPKYVDLDCRKYFDIDEEQDILVTLSEDHVLPPVLRYKRSKLPNLKYEDYGEAVKLIAMSDDADVEELLDANEENAADLMDALIIGVPAEQYPQLFTLLKELLDSQDPAEYLRMFLEEQQVTFKQGA